MDECRPGKKKRGPAKEQNLREKKKMPSEGGALVVKENVREKTDHRDLDS